MQSCHLLKMAAKHTIQSLLFCTKNPSKSTNNKHAAAPSFSSTGSVQLDKQIQECDHILRCNTKGALSTCHHLTFKAQSQCWKEYQMRSWPPMGITPWQSFQGIQQSTQMMNMISGVNDPGHNWSGWWSAKMVIKWSKISLTGPRSSVFKSS